MFLENLTDEELMTQYQNGSESAFNILYSRHSSKVYGYLKSRVKQVEVVAEMYQEVFIKIHKSKHLYNKSLPVLPWFYTITRTTMIDQIRRNKNSNLHQAFDFNQLPGTVFADRLVPDTILMIQNLPETQKQALHLRYVDDKTFEEIAHALQTTTLNARQLISRGIKRLKVLMKQGDLP